MASLKDEQPTDVQQKPSMSQILESADETGQLETSSLFVRGLSFSTTTSRLADTFRVLDGFVSALVKTKSDPKKPGQVLSMGFGFVEFRTKEQARYALKKPLLSHHSAPEPGFFSSKLSDVRLTPTVT